MHGVARFLVAGVFLADEGDYDPGRELGGGGGVHRAWGRGGAGKHGDGRQRGNGGRGAAGDCAGQSGGGGEGAGVRMVSGGNRGLTRILRGFCHAARARLHAE